MSTVQSSTMNKKRHHTNAPPPLPPPPSSPTLQFCNACWIYLKAHDGLARPSDLNQRKPFTRTPKKKKGETNKKKKET